MTTDRNAGAGSNDGTATVGWVVERMRLGTQLVDIDAEHVQDLARGGEGGVWWYTRVTRPG